MSPRHGLIDLRPLRSSAPFRRLWASALLSGLGVQVALVAVLFQVWDTTRNPFWVGAIGLAQAVPMISVGLVGGALADLVDRRRLALWATGGQAVTALALAGQLIAGTFSLPLVLGLVAAQAGCSALGAPARKTFTVRLLPRPLVPAGIALQMIAFQAAMLVGPAVGGVLLGVASAGACYLLNAVALVVAWATVKSLPAMPPTRVGAATATPVDRPSVWRRTRSGMDLITSGVRHVWVRPVLRGSFLLDLVATLLAFPVALFPMVNQERFDGDPRTLGLFLSAVALGGVTAGVGSGLVTRSAHLGRVQLGAVAVWGLALLVFGVAALLGPVWLLLGSLVLAGAADTVSVTSRAAVVQLATHDSHLGRVSAVEHVLGVGGPDIGNARAGAVAGLTTPAIAAITGAAACLVLTAWTAWAHPQVAAFSPEQEPPEASAAA